MVKALHFKGDPAPKKRKRAASPSVSTSKDLTTIATATKAATDAAEETQSDDSWVTAEAPTDISGPILVVLPTEPPSSLACDANGKVFASELENVVDGDPATAEPHDVRQVFVASRVAGTEGFSLKGHHGRYLGSDKTGALSATATAISPAESFTFIPVPAQPSAFSLQTARDVFITVSTASKTPSVLASSATIDFSTTLRIRMQARFKPRLKASKAEKALAKISRKELEDIVGRRLEEEEVKRLKRARREGDFHGVVLDFRVKGRHDKYASM